MELHSLLGLGDLQTFVGYFSDAYWRGMAAHCLEYGVFSLPVGSVCPGDPWAPSWPPITLQIHYLENPSMFEVK